MSSRLVVASTFSSAGVDFSTACSKHSTISTRGDPYTRGLFGGVREGLPGGVSGGRGEVGGCGTKSMGAIVSAFERLPKTEVYEANNIVALKGRTVCLWGVVRRVQISSLWCEQKGHKESCSKKSCFEDGLTVEGERVVFA